MRPYIVVASLFLVACPSGDDTSDASTTGDTGATTATTGAPPTKGDPGTTGLMPRCFPPSQLDYAFYFEPDPGPGFGDCEVTGVDPLQLACEDDFTLMLGNSKDPGLVVGEQVQVDYRVGEGEGDTSRWLRIRNDARWFVVAADASTLEPPGSPTTWFPPGLAVAKVTTECVEKECPAEDGHRFTPRAISFGGAELVTLEAGDGSEVPGVYFEAKYYASVQRAQTGNCQPEGATVERFAWSIVGADFF